MSKKVLSLLLFFASFFQLAHSAGGPNNPPPPTPPPPGLPIDSLVFILFTAGVFLAAYFIRYKFKKV